MKKIFLSMVMGFFLLTFSTFANAWHLEYSISPDSGVFWIDGDSNSFVLEGSDGSWADAGWAVMSATGNPDGSISVEYAVYPGWYDFLESRALIQFRILSDYGNMNHVPIDTTVYGDAFAGVGVYADGNDFGLEGWSSVWAGLLGNYGSELFVDVHADNDQWVGDYFDQNSFNENIQLLANTWYEFEVEFVVDVYAEVLDLPPSEFESQADYDAFFDGIEYGHIEAYTLESGLFYHLSIDDPAEAPPVPVPATILLFGLGILCLTGVRRKNF